jgi:magnesium-transporting ATPase (P-type)
MSKVMAGDLVVLQEGMEIPADGYVIEANELTTDESAMTGETDPVKKNTLAGCIKKRDQMIANGTREGCGHHDVPNCIIMSGTKILTGDGKMIITVLGDSSC